MTLITHFRNIHLSFLAGDGIVSNHIIENTGEKKILFENNYAKIFKCHNIIVGLFGKVDKELIIWLKETYKTYAKDEVEEKLNQYFQAIKLKYLSDQGCTINEGINLIYSSENLFFLESTKYSQAIPLGMKGTEAEIINSISCKEYFFSPQLNDANEIDFEHQSLIESLFIESFKDIYQIDYNKNIIQFDENLNKLIGTFYSKVYDNPSAHKYCINGTVTYSVLQQNMPSEIQRIEFELSKDFPTCFK